jgi:hypothetical protein
MIDVEPNEIEFQCPNCGNDLSQTMENLKAEKHMTCPEISTRIDWPTPPKRFEKRSRNLHLRSPSNFSVSPNVSMPNAKLASKRTGVVTASRLCGLLVRPVDVEHGKNHLAACKRWCAQTTELPRRRPFRVWEAILLSARNKPLATEPAHACI